jgi:hypothetical protein
VSPDSCSFSVEGVVCWADELVSWSRQLLSKGGFGGLESAGEGRAELALR